MADVIFTGAAGTGNLATAGNWDTGLVPAVGENVIIDRTAYDLYGDISANNVGSIKVTPGWKGQALGSLTTSFKFQCTANQVDLQPSPRCNLMRIEGSGTTAKLRILSTGSGQCFLVAGTFTQTEGGEFGGDIVVGTSPVLTTLYTINSRFRLGSNGTAVTTAFVSRGGELETERSLATVHCAGGKVRPMLTAAISTKAWIYAGELNLRSSGTVAEAEIFSGAYLSLTGAEKSPTVTALKTHAGAIIERQGKGVKLTYTETPVGWTNA